MKLTAAAAQRDSLTSEHSAENAKNADLSMQFASTEEALVARTTEVALIWA